jgi:hypothetical protein
MALDHDEEPRLLVAGATAQAACIEDPPLDVLGNGAVGVAPPVALARDGQPGVQL